MYLNFTIAYAGLQLGFLHNRIKQLFLISQNNLLEPLKFFPRLSKKNMLAFILNFFYQSVRMTEQHRNSSLY